MEENIRIQELLKIIKKRLLLLISITSLSVLVTGIVSYFFLTPIYESSTQLLINRKQPDQLSSGSINVQENLELINTYRVIIKSPAILDLVKEELNLDRSIKNLAKQINVTNEQNSQVVTITVQDPNQKLAVDIANTTASQFENVITSIMNLDNVTILSQADEETSKDPVKPRPIFNMLIAFTLTLFVTIGLVFLLEYLDDTLKTEHDIKTHLEFPVLGTIPVKKVSDFNKLDKKHEVKKGVKLQELFKKKEKLSSWQLITMINPRSPISEQYRTIRTNIEYSNIDRENRMIMVTSSTPGEGKTTTSANIAIVFAQQGKKVLLIDADFRKPMIHNVFRKKNFIGLTSVLIKQIPVKDAIKETNVNNLYVLTSGPITPNPSELLSSKSMRNLLTTIKKEFSYVIIDTPPLLPVTDAQILANQCDGVVFVINSGNTKIEHAEKAKTLLRNTNARLLGTVLNNIKDRYQDYYYYDRRE